jgi:hypothetical protein
VGDVAVGLGTLEPHPHRVAPHARGIDGDDLGGELVVALAEDSGAHGHRLAHRGLGREPTEVDHGGDVHHGYASNHAPTLANP